MNEPAAGLFQSLRRLLDTLVGIAQVRLELLGTEYEQEKRRLVNAFVKAALGIVLLGLTLVLLVAFVVLLVGEAYWLSAVGVLALLFAAVGGALLWSARAGLEAHGGGPFALSLGELRRDREGLAEPPSER